MKIIIKRTSDLNTILKKMESIKSKGNFPADKFCGVIKLKGEPLELQLKMRGEWGKKYEN